MRAGGQKDWQDCLHTFAKPVQPNPALIRSLLVSSEDTAYAASLLPLAERTTSTKVANAYDALRELLEALALQHGYKIYNHECYTAFLKEVLRKSTEGEDFDSFRLLRNSLKYYGKRLSEAEAAALIEQMERLRTSLTPLIRK